MPRRWAACSTRSTMPTPASPEPRRYRGALIGAGGIARQSHLPALRGAATLRARVDVVAIVDSAPGVPPVDGIPLLRDHAALRELAPLDFIDICTPTASHLELTVWGLEQGYHVVCEKPVALTRVEAERIAAASRASGRIVMPCHQYRYNPVWQRVKEWLPPPRPARLASARGPRARARARRRRWAAGDGRARAERDGTGWRAARSRHASRRPAPRRGRHAGRGERLDRPAAACGLRRRRHGGPAGRVSRPAGDDGLHLGGAHAREPHPLRRGCRNDRVGGR